MDTEALLALLGQSHLFPSRSHGLLRAGIKAWFVGDYVKAIHVLVPQVEVGLREMLRAFGESPMRHNPHEDGFETLGMGTLLVNPVFKETAHPAFRLHLTRLDAVQMQRRHWLAWLAASGHFARKVTQ
ncbi:hypothetical protein [Janthinobacterium lividum]|uniref:hypothetical protein n=1 Tax=Janthinobacterium lividum TaxID=29581 RepID=UPI000930AF6E|nr:hypothetical protein [Janthinobacterium lividum]